MVLYSFCIHSLTSIFVFGIIVYFFVTRVKDYNAIPKWIFLINSKVTWKIDFFCFRKRIAQSARFRGKLQQNGQNIS